MPEKKQAISTDGRRHLSADTLGRQLRAAFDPVPTAADEFADLLRRIDEADADLEPAG